MLVKYLGAWAVSYTYNFLMTWSSYGKQINMKKLVTAIYSQEINSHYEIISMFIVSRKKRARAVLLLSSVGVKLLRVNFESNF